MSSKHLVLAVVVVLVAAIFATTAAAAPGGPQAPHQRSQGLPAFDARAHAERTTGEPTGKQAGALAGLTSSLGRGAVVQLDPLTHTPRLLADLNGFISGPHAGTPANAALSYVKDHLDAFGLTNRDVAQLRLVRDYQDIEGVHHITWAQEFRGIPAFDNFLRANVAADGSIVSFTGAPAANLGAHSIVPGISAEKALGLAMRDAHGSGVPPAITNRGNDNARTTAFAGGHRANLVFVSTPGGMRLAWLVNAKASTVGDYEYVLDAGTGALLYRQNLVKFATGKAWDYFSTSLLPAGVGSQTLRTYPSAWGPTDATKLQGNFAHVYADVNDDNTPTAGAFPAGDEIPASSTTGPTWQFTFSPFNGVGSNCSAGFACSWNSATPNSWKTNLKQNAAQVFYYVSNFHDALMAAPIGFTPAAGNFQQTNPSGQGLGGDAVQAQVDDGANTLAGLPDDKHMDNANMSTPPDGQAPRMQMYLFVANTIGSNQDGNGGDDASVIYHEYTHGLSNRLVTTALGIPALNAFQSGAMGEAWSDWYAMDYLVKKGFDSDTPVTGDVVVGQFLLNGSGIRTEGIDCPALSDPDGNCFGGSTPHFGGYTYGDMGSVSGGPEVHADGEIWGQTIWQIRQQLGASVAETLITRALDLSVPNPSMLDMRNFILEADAVYYNNAHKAALWNVFANRGMGWFAETNGANDTNPTEDRTQAGPPPATASMTGTVTSSGSPVPGAVVQFSGHGNGADTLFAVSSSNGSYTVNGLTSGHQYNFTVSAPGYDKLSLATPVLAAGANTNNITGLIRNWAMLSGGGTVTSFSAPDYSGFGCGPSGAIDGSQATGWGSDMPGPRTIVIKLARPVNVSGISIDPGATCGDGDTASLGAYTLETSPDNATYTTAATGTFTAANNHILNAVTLLGGKSNVQYVKLTETSNQGDPGFLDMSEIEVYGAPAGSVAAPTITSVTPGFGPRKANVTINGANLTGATAVQFNGVDSKYTVSSATKIVATVPDAAPIGSNALAVTTRGGTVRAASAFNVTSPVPPTITSISPVSGPTGTSVTITGTNLAGVTGVKFGSTGASSFTMVSPSTLKAVVAPGQPAAAVHVTVTATWGSVTSGGTFTPTLGLSSFTPTTGLAGATPTASVVTVTGYGFNASSKVKFGALAAQTTFVSATQLKANVPAGAVTGKLSVTNTTAPVGTAMSSANFVPTLSISSFSPASGPAGATVTVNGVGFNATSVVKFNGVAATTTFVSASKVTAAVPAGATTGKITVTNSSAPVGTVVSVATFTKT